MPKIYLSPAAHANDHACCYSGTCSENTHANLYMDQLEVYLTACGFETKRAPKTNTGAKNADTVKESNAWAPDLHYVAHTNSFNGSVNGSRIYVYKTGAGKDMAEIILKHRREIYPYLCQVKVGDFAEITDTNAIAIYEELVFHDNMQDATWFHENMRRMAEYTARAFCEIFGLDFVDPYYIAPAPEPEPTQEPAETGTLYRVQVGAFSVRANADNLAADLKGKGYAAFVTE